MKSPTLTRERVLKQIKRFPGYRAVDHAADLDCTPADLRPHLIALSRSGEIKPSGNTRATVWR